MIAAYIAIDSFGTACNVTGDGAIALVIDKLAKGTIQRSELDDDDELGLAAAIAGIEETAEKEAEGEADQQSADQTTSKEA